MHDQVVCHGDTRVSPSKEGEDPYAEPKARGIFVKVAMMMGNGDQMLSLLGFNRKSIHLLQKKSTINMIIFLRLIVFLNYIFDSTFLDS